MWWWLPGRLSVVALLTEPIEMAPQPGDVSLSITTLFLFCAPDTSSEDPPNTKYAKQRSIQGLVSLARKRTHEKFTLPPPLIKRAPDMLDEITFPSIRAPQYPLPIESPPS